AGSAASTLPAAAPSSHRCRSCRHNTRGPDVRYAAMRLSQYPISTLKEVPADADIISHQLMLRAGMIRRLAAGLYTWLPIGLRTLKKVERIIREEMDRAGAF